MIYTNSLFIVTNQYCEEIANRDNKFVMPANYLEPTFKLILLSEMH